MSSERVGESRLQLGQLALPPDKVARGLAGAPYRRRARVLRPKSRSQRLDELRAMYVAALGILGERPVEHGVERGRKLGTHLRQARRQVLDLSPQGGERARALEGHATREAFEQQTGQRILVGAPVHGVVAHLLRGHVLDGAEKLAGAREAPVGARRLRETEVREVWTTREVEENVRRLHVPVHEAGRVSAVECVGERLGESQGMLGGERPVACEDRAQVLALDETRREVQGPVGLSRRVDRQHMRVLDRRG